MWLDLAGVERALKTRTLGRRVVYLTSTHSTMDVARAEAEAGAPDGTAVLAEEQTSGRGRFGRTWVSPAGRNIYVTLLLRPPLAALRSLSIVAPLAVAEAVQDVAGLDARIKWPNDVLVGGRKLSGTLIESEVSGAEVRYSLVGIGVNVNFDVDSESEIGEIATSVKRELGREVSREETLAALLNRFEALYGDPVAAHREWRQRLETLGREVKVRFGDQVYEGLAEAGAVMASEPATLQLRYLQTLTEIASERNSTVVFPIPIDLITMFLSGRGTQPGDTVPPASPRREIPAKE